MKMKQTSIHITISLIATLSIVGFFCLLNPLWQTNDDIGMSMLAHGYGTASLASSNLLFSNVLWGHLVRSVPTFNGVLGYSSATFFSIMLAGSVIFFSLLYCGKSVFCCFVILLLILPRPTLSPQFTVNAGLLAVAAFSLLETYTRHVKWPFLAAGCLLFFWGFLVRSEQAVLMLLIAFPLFSWRTILRTRSAKITLSITFFLLILAVFVDKAAYKGNEWLAYKALQGARAPITDFGTGEYLVKRPDILTRHGFSLNDVRLVRSWFFEDSTVANPEKLREMYDEIEPNFLQPGAPSKGIKAIKTFFHPWLLWILLPALFFSVLSFRCRLFLSWTLSIGIFFILGLIGRPGILRVYLPVVILFLVMSIFLLENNKIKNTMYLLVFFVIGNSFILLPEHFQKNELSKRRIESLSNIPSVNDELVVTWGSAFPYESIYTPFQPIPQNFPYPLYGLGASALAPATVAHSKKLQGSGMLDQLKANKRIILVARNPEVLLLQTYFEEHWHAAVSAIPIPNAQELNFYIIQMEKN